MTIVAYEEKTGAIWGIGFDEDEAKVRKIADDKIKELGDSIDYKIVGLDRALEDITKKIGRLEKK